MHWIYAVYLALCVLQLPVFLTLWSHGAHALRGPTLVPRPEMSVNRTLDRWIVFEVRNDQTLDTEVGMACAAAVLWACVYMTIFSLESERAVNYVDVRAHTMIEDTQLRRCLEASRVLFWVCIGYQSYAFVGCMLRHHTPVTLSYLWRPLALRVTGLFGLTRTTDYNERKVRIYHGLALAGYMAGMGECAPAFSITWLVLGCIDGALVLFHVWDDGTPALVVLNSRLFYLACTGVLLTGSTMLHQDGWLLAVPIWQAVRPS